MQIKKQLLPKSQVELTIELPVEELQPYLEQAAQELAEKHKFPGFRPGKAPHNLVKQRLGSMEILRQAANAIIGQTFYQAADQEKLEIVDQPQIDIIKIAPDNPFIYKATAALLPQVELCDFRELKVDPLPKIEITAQNIDRVVDDLRNLRVKETLAERAAQNNDRVEIDFETFIDQIALAGGKAEKYSMVLGEQHMIPGFEEQVAGLKKDQAKEFELVFPKDYKDEKLAGKKALFKIKLLAVYNRELPEFNDDFAKLMGLKTAADLRLHIGSDLKRDKIKRAQQKQDIAIVEKIIEKSKYDDLPDVLINAEVSKMIEELKDNVANQGLDFSDYLNHLKKKESDLRLDFTPDAIKRVKTSLAIRKIAEQEKIAADEQEIHQEMDMTLKTYQLNPRYNDQVKQIQANINTPAAHRYFGNVITNRKVMAKLRQIMADNPPAEPKPQK